MSEQDERAFRALTDKITLARGISCASYKDKCLRRRIAVRMRARGVHSFEAYAALLDQDAKEYDHLLDALTINVTKFYRNPETWAALAPFLAERWRAQRGNLAAWSAGCASGEEPYSVAVALAETARGAGRTIAAMGAGHLRVTATDIDRVSLERAQTARYVAGAFSEMPMDLVSRWFEAPDAEGLRSPRPEIRTLVSVLRHDLTRDRPPDPPYDLVLCRNVVIYFDRSTQERLFAMFAAALHPGGILVLGKVETLFGPARELLRLEDPRERIYRKPA